MTLRNGVDHELSQGFLQQSRESATISNNWHLPDVAVVPYTYSADNLCNSPGLHTKPSWSLYFEDFLRREFIIWLFLSCSFCRDRSFTARSVVKYVTVDLYSWCSTNAKQFQPSSSSSSSLSCADSFPWGTSPRRTAPQPHAQLHSKIGSRTITQPEWTDTELNYSTLSLVIHAAGALRILGFRDFP